MKKVLHKAEERGTGEYGWLHTRLSFSFAGWYDPEKMGFGALRVLNDDSIEPGFGFDMHPHDNMEIITIVSEGAVTHKDSLGNSFDVPAGDVQVMSAGTGSVHSEKNDSKTLKLALFQIWILPRERDIPPRYSQKSFKKRKSGNALELLVSPDGSEGSLSINQDACIHRGTFAKKGSLEYQLKNPNNGVYIFVIDGAIAAEGEVLLKRDALGVWDADTVVISSPSSAEFLLLEVPML